MMNKEEQALSCVIEELINQGVKTKLNKELNILIQALTPPTEEEVCEALSEWTNETVIYDKERKDFYYWFQENEKVYIADFKLNELSNKCITLIGRFYEKESERE